jgi:hypothetical protein
MIANAPPIHDEAQVRAARRHDQAADRRFVAALAPMLTSEARQPPPPRAARPGARLPIS